MSVLFSRCGSSAFKALAGLLFIGLLSTPVGAQDDYRLDTGDIVKVTVFGETDLSGDFKVNDNGTVSMGLVGDVSAKGLTATEVEEAIVAALKPDYLINPSVTVQVLSYRPFFIMGEVRNPGSYQYASGMSILEAVALAGGFTYRARTEEVYLRREGESPDDEKLMSVDLDVLPGDVIRVRERFF
ncbi:MAG: polysaccharide biosynthesis/export family protein [Alphaproteobacteria bacterium]